MAYQKGGDLNYNEEQGNQTSRLNAAGLINSSLENLWNRCYSAMNSGNLVAWNRNLDAIWTILGGDCEDGDETDEKMSQINLQIYRTGSLNHKKSGFEKLKDDESETMALQYLLLNKKSVFLRRLQNRQGKGTAYVSEDQDDFD